MQSSLCLHTACPNVKIRHSPLALSPASSVILQRQHCQLGLALLSCKGLRAGPGRRPMILAMRAHVTPPEDGIDKNKAEEARRGMVRPAVAAAVVMVCTLGAMCTGWKATAIPSSWFGGLQRSSDRAPAPSKTEVVRDIQIEGPRPMQQEDTKARVDDDQPPSTMQEGDRLTKSIRSLKEIFDWKCDSGAQKPAKAPGVLLEILNDAFPEDQKPKWQKYIDQLKKDENPEAATKSLYEEWRNRKPGPDTYNLGLVLIDLLINLGGYERANYVCGEIEKLASDLDQAPKIRRAILDVMLSADAIRSEVKDTEKSRMLKQNVELLVRKLLQIALHEETFGPPQLAPP